MMPLLHWAQNNFSLALIGLLAAIVLFKELLLGRYIKNIWLLYAILFPGVVLHELAHVIGCLLTFSKIKSVSLFSRGGGHVEYYKSRISLISNIIVSVSPLIMGLVVLFYLSVKSGINFIGVDFYGKNILSDIFIAYLMISVAIGMIPSMTDVKNAIFGYIGLVCLIIWLNNTLGALPFSLDILIVLSLCVVILFMINLSLAIYKKIF